MPRAGMVIVALHAGAFAGQDRDADAVAGAGIAAEKACAGGERDRACGESWRRRLRNW